MDVARQENGEHQFDADRTGRLVWHERLVWKWDIPQLGGVCMFGCIDCAIHVKVRLTMDMRLSVLFSVPCTVVARIVDEGSNAGHLL